MRPENEQDGKGGNFALTALEFEMTSPSSSSLTLQGRFIEWLSPHPFWLQQKEAEAGV